MATSKKDIICEYALSTLNNITSFAKFVSYAEDLVQVDELFRNDQSRDDYHQIWFELEIINAVALSEWENEGCPRDWQNRWESDYRQEASNLIDMLLNTLN
ncbi:hypothetical protein [Erwinia amylovora]|uniref:Uncharacterized protein n=1 Tax=Erwinia amylovora TaxID=552 RepID=A0ABX7MKE5_ERWAM|nr:hypothetical protein [Erwinia amylovora]CDK14265.1 hypothetical protein LA635_0641 [Erwinia amylovora LA635]CDK17632.1 hypothetical protein LA636_0640 [Erwinia amylovora LA636]CDK21001.1 hypothetical protein LA637_0641 [Erwinia amylovora LA637]ATZ12523.1 hypothetical protein AD997_14200 [Erwinia amylovora]MBZ2391091.1 hypothetical protein [Erwinia amylovora]